MTLTRNYVFYVRTEPLPEGVTADGYTAVSLPEGGSALVRVERARNDNEADCYGLDYAVPRDGEAVMNAHPVPVQA